MKMNRAAVLFALVSLSAACAKEETSPGAASPTSSSTQSSTAASGGDENTQAMDKAVLVMDQVAGLFEKYGSDCDKLAKELDAVGSSNAPALAKMHTLEKSWTPAQKEEIAKKYGDRIAAAQKRIAGVAMNCQNSQLFKDALKKMNLGD